MLCDWLELPPSPVHEIVKVLFPAVVIVTVSVPEVPVCVVHGAEQDVALVEAQEISTVPPSKSKFN